MTNTTAQLRQKIAINIGITHKLSAEHSDHTVAALEDTMQDIADYISQLELPRKPDNSLIQKSLQNGKPQQAASYNGYAAAINDTTAILAKAIKELLNDR